MYLYDVTHQGQTPHVLADERELDHLHLLV
jgi:hypothetical protein